jgi:hypothetical protein
MFYADQAWPPRPIQEVQFRIRPQACRQQIVEFRKQDRGEIQRSGLGFHDSPNRDVMGVVGIVQGVDASRVTDQGYCPFLVASRRISRAFSETSLCPL